MAIYIWMAEAQMLVNIDTMTKKQGCALAIRDHSLADGLSLFI